MNIPEKYNPKEREPYWQKFWEKEKVFSFDSAAKGKVYSVDTPPPTVSGKMHIGHAFSYSQQDFIVRYHRMKGETIFYPFGTDDNGLPTERLVEKLKNVKSTRMERQDFVTLCNQTIKEIKPAFVQDWKNIGMSCDWETTYSTIDPHCVKTSQKSFLDLHKKGLVYQQEAPTMWCVQCQTAIAQAELDDAEFDSFFSDISFELEGGSKDGNKGESKEGNKITIATTRPELLGACVCIYVHPQDKRYTKLVGKKAVVPLFGQVVPIFADESANPEKGTGILMICSYGDKFDVEAIKKRKLTPRIVITKDGKMNEITGKYKGLPIKEARKEIIKDLEERGLLTAKKQIRHAVNVHERCGVEIEFLSTKQWFIRILQNKEKFISAGRKLKWYPTSMQKRYENWVTGVQWDWCISRQRHFGVPFPVWGCAKCGAVKAADEGQLPLDPLQVKLKEKCSCGGEWQGEKDVMDTWATSSVSPQIIFNWAKDKGFKTSIEMYPASLRPQAHDIIRTWAFYTIIKGIYHQEKVPWNEIAVSGWVLDPKGEKMSKSKGNVIEPQVMIDKYSADALRFWAGSSKLGEDIPFQEKELVSGNRFVQKLWNASKFSLPHLEDFDGKKPKQLELMDKWILTKLNKLVAVCTKTFEEYDYSKTKTETEKFFWHDLCDNYLELVKERLYNPELRGAEARKSGQYALYQSLLTVLKLMAPITPYITEEVYWLYFAGKEKKKSIHLTKWPKMERMDIDEEAEKLGDEIVAVISTVRKYKSSKQMSLRLEIKELIVEAPSWKEKLALFEKDLKAITNSREIKIGKGEIPCENFPLKISVKIL